MMMIKKKRKKTISRLRIRVVEDKQKRISVRLRFNDGKHDYVIDVPDMFQRRLNRLVMEFQKSIAISESDDFRDLVVDKNYLVRLQSNRDNR